MPVTIGTIIQASYYNSLQTIISGILGPSGYNLTVTSNQLSVGAIATAIHWNNLRTDLNVIQNIQAGSPFSSSALPAIVVGTIIYAATINLYEAAVTTVQAGYAGNLILVNNAFSDTRSSAWTAQIDDEVTISFASAAAAGNFFTTNGELRLTLSQTTNANTTDSAWLNNLISIGTIVMNKSTTTRTGTGGTPIALGWNGLTTSYQSIYSGVNLVASSYYSNDSVYVYAKLTSAGDGVTIRTLLVNGGSGTVSSSTKATWGYKKAVAAGTPAFAFVAPNNFDDNAVGSGNGSTLPTITAIANYFAATTYTGNASTQTINTGVNLSDSTGGLLWIKGRNVTAPHFLQSGAQNATGLVNPVLDSSNTTVYSPAIAGFTSTGFNLGPPGSGNSALVNSTSQSYIAWSFRRAQKFFDIVTWTGDGTGARVISHNLGITPGMIIVKDMSSQQDWPVWHANLQNESTIRLNTNGNFLPFDNAIQGVTSTKFNTSAINGSTLTNRGGAVYVAYLFANDTSSTGYIQTGAITGSGAQSVTLGWEPQYIMIKGAAGPDDWHILDSKRGFSSNGTNTELLANTTSPDASTTSILSTPTGFILTTASGAYVPYIWVAIRKNDPVAATSLFNARQYTGFNHIQTAINVGFAPTLAIAMQRSANGSNQWSDINRGSNNLLRSNDSSIEMTFPNSLSFSSTGIVLDLDNFSNSWNSNYPVTLLTFKSSPDFFEPITWPGATSNINLGFNWSSAPKMMIIKCRSGIANAPWRVWHVATGGTTLYSLNDNSVLYPSSAAIVQNGSTIDIPPLTLPEISQPGATYIGYAFGTKAGVSMVGSYAGDGASTKVIPCGFAAGARFVMIKNVNDTTANWRMWNYADGITSTTHMRFGMEISAAPVSDPSVVSNGTTGFTASGVMNQNGATYIFLAIA